MSAPVDADEGSALQRSILSPDPDVELAGLRDRVFQGVGALALRGLTARLLTLGANVLLVRLIAPHEFGLIAAGGAFVLFATFLSDGGLAAGLVRSEAEPSLAQLGAVRSVQVGTLTAATAIAFASVPLLGRPALVTAVLMSSLPIVSWRTPAIVRAERAVEFGRISRCDLVEAVAYVVVALVLAYLDAGVWALAFAVVGRALAGTLYLARGPRYPLRIDVAQVRPVLSFGLRFQSVGFALLLRDQVANLVIGGIGGFRTLGLYNMLGTLLQAPNLVLEGMFRIAFPAMNRLRAANRDLTELTTRVTSAILLALASSVAAICGAAGRGIPHLLGPRWSADASALAWYAQACVLVAPIGVSASGLLQAMGRPLRLAAALATNAVIFIAGIAVLAPSRGVTGAGEAFAFSTVFEAAVLLASLRDVWDLRRMAPLLRMQIGAAASVAAAYHLGYTMPDSVAGAIAGAGAGLLVGAAGTALLAPRTALQGARMLRDGVHTLRRAR